MSYSPLNKAAIAAHKFSFKNHNALIQPQTCGCFYCLKIFPSSDLRETDFLEESDGQKTAWCPHCGIDSIIGEASGYTITPELLQEMHDYWFKA